MVGSAGHILHTLLTTDEVTTSTMLTNWQTDLKRIMTLLGHRDLQSLGQEHLLLSPTLLNYCDQRHLIY